MTPTLLTQFLPLPILRINQSSRMDQIWSYSWVWETRIFLIMVLPSSPFCPLLPRWPRHCNRVFFQFWASRCRQASMTLCHWSRMSSTGRGGWTVLQRLSSFCHFPVFLGVRWLVAAWLRSHGRLFSVSVRCLLPSKSVWPHIRISPFYKDTGDIGWGPTLETTF